MLLVKISNKLLKPAYVLVKVVGGKKNAFKGDKYFNKNLSVSLEIFEAHFFLDFTESLPTGHYKVLSANIIETSLW